MTFFLYFNKKNQNHLQIPKYYSCQELANITQLCEIQMI